VDDRGHQPQHPAGALEALQAAPVVIEAFEQLGVDGVGGLHVLPIVPLTDPMGELGGVGLVHLVEGADDQVPSGEVVGLGDGLEQPAADDLEALVGGGRLPGGLHPAEGVLQPVQGLAATLAANLDVRRRQAGHYQGALARPGRLGEALGEAQIGVEGARWQTVHAIELAHEGNPLVDQHQGRAEALEQVCQDRRPRRGAVRIGLGHPRVACLAPQLPGHLSPQGVDPGAVRLELGLSGG
jgi:hypothetical protein